MSQLQYGQQTDEFKNIMCEKIRPDYEGFRKHGSSLIAVIERCKANFQQKQWDVGAFYAYDVKGMRRLGHSALPSSTVGECLLAAQKNRESNLQCMSDYLGMTYKRSSTAVTFWSYEKSNQQAAASGSSDEVDACIVFSGPAKKNDTSLTTRAFQNCSHDYSGSGCMIPQMIWSSNSKNKIPVAKLHTVQEISKEDRRQNALSMFEEAYVTAMQTLNELKDFADNNLEVVLFSGIFFNHECICVLVCSLLKPWQSQVKEIPFIRYLTAWFLAPIPVWTFGIEEQQGIWRFHIGHVIPQKKDWIGHWTFLALDPSSSVTTTLLSHVGLIHEDPSSSTLSGMLPFVFL